MIVLFFDKIESTLLLIIISRRKFTLQIPDYRVGFEQTRHGRNRIILLLLSK